MTPGVWVALGAVALAVAFGTYRAITDGRARRVHDHAQRLTAADLGHELGSAATLVQFSTGVCAPCRTAHRVLSELTSELAGVQHIEVDAENRTDLVDRFNVVRTPTILLLDSGGVVERRFTGVPRRPDVLTALADLAPGTLAGPSTPHTLAGSATMDKTASSATLS